MVKFSDEVIYAVREASGTYKEISERFGVSISQVGNIRRGIQRVGAPTEIPA
jgi:transcriptional regulator with XRE-family HTH domain